MRLFISKSCVLYSGLNGSELIRFSQFWSIRLDFIYIGSLYGIGLRVWGYSLKAIGWVGYSIKQGVKNGEGAGIIIFKGISGGVGNLNLSSSSLANNRWSF